jgi:cystathionine beta-lyase
VQAGAVTVTLNGFHAKGPAAAVSNVPMEESDAAPAVQDQ